MLILVLLLLLEYFIAAAALALLLSRHFTHFTHFLPATLGPRPSSLIPRSRPRLVGRGIPPPSYIRDIPVLASRPLSAADSFIPGHTQHKTLKHTAALGERGLLFMAPCSTLLVLGQS